MGAGFTALDGYEVGGGLRVRVGVGARQEVGVEGTAAFVDTGKADASSPSWIGKSAAWGFKLSYKGAPTDWLAFVAGAGGSETATGTALGGDLAAILAWPTALRGIVRPYGGVRGTFAIPVGRAIDAAGGVTAGLVVPVGLAFEPRPWLRLFVEAGFVDVWSERYDSGTVMTPKGMFGAEHVGMYGTVGASFILGRKS